jgi:hypothetical protein
MEFPNSFSNLKDPVNMGGTTGTKKYRNSKKYNYWIVKRSEKGAGGWAQVQSEAMANEIYKVCGIPVPAQKLYPEDKALVLEVILGRLLKDCLPQQQLNIRLKLGDGFVVDALLANWDVLGQNQDNIIVSNNGNGTPFRIDNGGSLTFRAQGEKKEFGPEVKELKTMRDPKINPNAAKYFGHLTDSVIKDQIQQIIKPNKAAILAVTSYELKEVMEKRIDYMLNWSTTWMNETQFVNSKKETAASEEATRAVEEAIIDFFWVNWNANYELFAFANTNENSVGVSAAANAMYAQTQKRKNKLLRYIKHLLQTHNAKISGGFLLKAMGKFEGGAPSYDMDVYVPHASVEPFRTEMGKLFLGHQPTPADYSQINASGGPTSFFTKNGIVSVRKHHRGIEGTPTYEEMDIVEANDTTSPINIIKNFDLTFCENWYDGKNVWLTHADHVEKKHGFLENHYLELLYINKPQTIGRIKKYAGRGFRVSIVNPITKKPEEITDKILAGQIVNYSGAAAAAPAAQANELSALKKEIEDAEIMAQSYAQDSADANAAKEEAKNIYFEALEEYEAKYPDNANHQSANAIKAYEPVKAKHKIYNEFKKKEEEATKKADEYFKIAKDKANLLKEKGRKYLQMPQRQQINTRIKPENAKTVINARNARPNVSPNNFKPNAVAEPTENLEKFLLDNPVPLNFFEIQCRDQWIGSGYTGLNAFLQGIAHPNRDYDWTRFLTPYFPKEAGETDAHYQQRKLYYFFVNLYNVVQKGPAYSEVFKVYRGTRTWYLKEENAKAQFYYLNSFAATSTSKAIALAFGGDKSYVFYVHPSCRYMSFRRDIINAHSERELLLTPYHRYLYVKEIKEGKNTFKIYLIFPTDLEIPNTFDTFMPWKEGKADLSRALEGGRDIRGLEAIQPVRNNRKNQINKSRKLKNSSKRNASRKQKNLNVLYNVGVSMPTLENKSAMPALENKSAMLASNSLQNSLSEENVLYKLGVYMPLPEKAPTNTNRFTDPISSFKGAPPNAKELEMAAKMVKFFEKNPI